MGGYPTPMDRTDWWRGMGADLGTAIGEVWIPVGSPGFAGDAKGRWRSVLDDRFGADGWRYGHIVRGEVVPTQVALLEYEASYRRYLRDRRALVRFLVETCGNVYDYAVDNVRDDDYDQPHTPMNHYQDISVRRVIAELVDDDGWADVVETAREEVPLLDLGTGAKHVVPRARGFRGDHLLQIREPDSPGYMLSPAVVPAHDVTLLSTLPGRVDWYHTEGCGHLSVEAFWQMSKVIEVRYDRFLELGSRRVRPLADL
jgi:hypothetical protein